MPENTDADVVRDPPDAPAYSRELWHRPGTLPGSVPVGTSRAESAANEIARLAAKSRPGERIGSKDDIRRLCKASVGAVNEAIKLAQERGVITSRPGPGGGIFALDPSPLSRMNGWFRSAAGDSSALEETIEIRDALAPLLVDAVLAEITDADQRVLDDLMVQVHRARDEHDVVGLIWAAWDVHEHFAAIGRSKLLDNLYLSIMDVGTSHLRARLEGRESVPVYLDEFAAVVEHLVTALADRDTSAAVAALRATDPTMVLREPARVTEPSVTRQVFDQPTFVT